MTATAQSSSQRARTASFADGASADTAPPLLAYFGHHKCATGWTDTILMEICFHMGLHFRIVHRPDDIPSYESLGTFAREEGVDFLSYTNADLDFASTLPRYRGFHVVRDPRDVLVSAYFSHRFSHPTSRWPALEEHRERLQQVSKEEGLFLEMEFSRWVFEQMHKWDYDQEHVLELKMETLTANPVQELTKVMRFLGMLDEERRTVLERMARQARLKVNRLHHRGRHLRIGNVSLFPVPRRPVRVLPDTMLKRIIRQKSFKKMAGGREKGEENVKSHFRKGQPGDWKNHFTEAHKKAFKTEFNDVLVKLGYERDAGW